jgi:hypothetical protein
MFHFSARITPVLPLKTQNLAQTWPGLTPNKKVLSLLKHKPLIMLPFGLLFTLPSIC